MRSMKSRSAFTAEFAIRPYIIRYPDQTLEQAACLGIRRKSACTAFGQ